MTSIIIKVALALMLGLSIASCRSHQTVSVPAVVTQVVHDSVSNTRVLHDSVLEYRDRLVRMLGDTVYVRDSIYLRRIVHDHDSVFVHKVDSIPYRVEVLREVPRKRNWLDWVCYTISFFCVLGICVAIYRRF